jgi:ATP-dependent helicase/nuclease subunit A
MSALDAAEPGANATVFASAGSGKTWLLVTRIIRLLLLGARPGGVLAVTFTRKAAAEMQLRLSERLAEWLALDDRALGEALREIGVHEGLAPRARALYESMLYCEQPLRTTTFHALCQDILRRFPLEADVPAGFELVEETRGLQQEAWDALFAEATAHPDGPVADALQTLFEATNGLDNTHAALTDFLDHRGDWWAYTEAADDPLEHGRARLEETLGPDTPQDPCAGFFDASNRRHMGEFCELLARHPTQTNLAHAATLQTALETADPDGDTFQSLCPVFLTGQGSRRKRGPSRTQAKRMGEQGEMRFLALHDALSEAVERSLERLARAATRRRTLAWYRAGQAYLGHYQRIKHQRRVLDFSDLEWRGYRLLNKPDHAEWVQYKLDQNVDHFLIDEFQDTNPTQWRLLLPLFEELAAGDCDRERSVFLVGDVKQSIYGFRRARPELQAIASHWLGQRLGARRFPLDVSWRSSPAIIEFVNRVFGEGPLAEQLQGFHPHVAQRRGLWGRIELLPRVAPGEAAPDEDGTGLRNPLHAPRAGDPAPPHYGEGRLISTRIKRLVTGRTVVGEAQEAHPLGYDDIIILVRDRSQVRHIERALRETGIPYLGTEQGTLLQHLEVQDMVALLECLITPFDDLTLAQLLRSPLFGAHEDDLVLLAQRDGGSWWRRLAALAPELPEDHTLRRARALLQDWAALAGRAPVHDLLDRIYGEIDVLGRYEQASHPAQRAQVRANLVRFLELALEVDSGRYPSLVHFINRLRSLRTHGRDAPDSPPALGREARVRIMTIHAAKGLEAPMVFVADCAGSDRRTRAHRTLIDWPASEPRPRLMLLSGLRAGADATIRSLQEQAHKAALHEEANLLYVALTRAKQLLVISASGADTGTDWYNQIRERTEAIGRTAEDGTWSMEYGAPPSAPKAPAKGDAKGDELEIDPRLSRPLALSPAELSIAPSHTIGPGGMVHTSDDAALLRGSAIHRFLEHLSGHPRPQSEDLCHQLAGELDLDGDHPQLHHWLEEAQGLISDPKLREIFDEACYEQAYNEVAIHYQSGDRTIHGVIDRLLVRRGGSVLIIDYKTHREPDQTAREEIIRRYQGQLMQYRQGVQRLWPQRSVTCALLFTVTHRLFYMDHEDAT